jgi:hypothetical protein
MGQVADWRLLQQGISVHVREFPDHYSVHRDIVHPKGLLGNLGHLIEDLPVVSTVLPPVVVEGYYLWKRIRKAVWI